jgi:hypothetical protein
MPKVTALTEDASPTYDDLILGVNDPGGTPASRKATIQAVMDLFEANMAAPTTIISSGTFADARIAASNVTQHQASLSITESQISDLGTYETADVDILKADTTDNLTVGYTTTSNNLGTVATGTTTLAFASGQVQRLVNGGAFTLAPPSSGEGTMMVEITNNASAGAITTSGFTSVTGDAFDTTNTNKFLCSVAVINGTSYLSVIAASGNA